MKPICPLVTTVCGSIALVLILVSNAQIANAESCIAAFEKDPCALLTEDLLRSTVQEAPVSVKKDEYKGKSFSSCTYSWPSDRKSIMKIAGREMPVPENNQISLSWIKTYEKDAKNMFRRAYLPTADEQKKAREMMSRSFDRQSKKRGLDKQGKKLGKEIINSKLLSPKFVAVDGIGTMASWESGSSGTLNVLDVDTRFKISSNISAETAEDKTAAVTLANAVLKACN